MMNGGKTQSTMFRCVILCLSLLFALLSVSAGYAGYFAFPFIGKWNNYESPITLDTYDYQDIQNLRPDGKRLKSVRGHTELTSSQPTDDNVAGVFHYKKSIPFAESHFLLSASGDPTGASYSLWDLTTAIPNSGEFSSSPVYTNTLDAASNNVLAAFSTVPQDTLVYSDGDDTVAWGGDENNPTAVILGDDKDAGGDFDDHTAGLISSSADSGYTATIGAGGDDTYAKLLLHMNGADGSTTFTDSGDTGHTVTPNGNSQIDTDYYKFGGASGLFDGAGDYLSITDHADFYFGTGNFTIEGWARFSSISGQSCLYAQAVSGSYVTLIQNHDEGKIRLSIVSSLSSLILLEGDWSPNANVFYHYAAVRGWGGSASGWAITINGETVATTTVSLTSPDIAASILIGSCTSSTVIDWSSIGHVIDQTVTISEASPVHGNGALIFNGSSDYMLSADSSSWDVISQTNFTIDLQVQHTDHAGGEYYIEHGDSGTDRWSFMHVHGTGLRFVLRSGGVYTIDLSGGEITDTNPHHVAVVKKGTEYGLYLDGVQTAYVDDNSIDSFSGQLKVGVTAGASGYFDGYMDDIRVDFSNVFNASPNSGLTDTITPPSATPASGTYTKLLISADIPYMAGHIDEYRLSKGIARYTSSFTPFTSAYSETVRDHVLVGSPYRLEKVTFYFSEPNLQSGTLNAYSYREDGWSQLAITDNTSSGGVPFAQDGAVEWDATSSDTRRLINYLDLYWYAFELPSGSSGSIKRVTTTYPAQSISNIWDGVEVPLSAFIWYDASATDFIDNGYTTYLQDDDFTTLVAIDSATASDYFLIGFPEPVKGINIRLVDGKENSTATTAAVVYFRSSSGWEAVSNAQGPLYDDVALGRAGLTQWSAVNVGTEVKYKSAYGEAADVPLYYYYVQFSGIIDAEVELYYITGIRSTGTVANYSLHTGFSERLWLFNEVHGEHNIARYSALNAPYIFNGSDSGVIRFGSGGSITGAATLYNVFQSTGYQQLIVTKETSTYRVLGSGPENWEKFTMSDTVGCTAPRSMTVVDAYSDEEGAQARHVAMWVSATGVVVCDGAKIESVSNDIRAYWDPNHPSYVSAATRKKAVGWYDPTIRAYKLILGTLELEYSLDSKSWTKLYREDGSGANPLVAACRVSDTNGGQYTYGVNDDVDLYRLEYGSSWDGEADIDQYVWTKDVLPDSDNPFFHNTLIEWFRLMFEDRSTSDNIVITHYCDGVATVNDTNDQQMPANANINAGPIYTTSCNLGRCLTHSFKIECDTDATDGLELNGMGLVFESFDAFE